MYTEFYDLNEKPFDLSPSSRFLYLGETHKEALALLTYGVLERQGFVLLTGEVGTGKTTMIHALLARPDPNVRLAHLSNPLVSPREFFDYLGHTALGRETPFHSKAEFLVAFETFLEDCLRSHKDFLLIIDEAHKLSFELLEEIRLLSNLETAEQKLIKVFLVGQPELRERLRHPSCGALLQRITNHYHLTPLDQKSVGEYIRTRLRVAGAKDPDKIFPGSVIKAIYKYSKGFPREINNISEYLLLLGYAQDKKRITRALVKECRNHMTPEPSKAEQDREPRGLLRVGRAAPRSFSTRFYLSAFVFLLLGVALGLAIGRGKNGMLGQLADILPTAKQTDRGIEGGPVPTGEKETIENHPPPRSEAPHSGEHTGPPQGITLKRSEIPSATESPTADTKEEDSEQAPPSSPVSAESAGEPSGLEDQAGRASGVTGAVKEGETSGRVSAREDDPASEDVNPIPVRQYGDIYDRIDEEILRPLKKEHPGPYRDFWEGLLHSDRGEGLPHGEGAGAREAAKKRVSHFVRSAPEIERAARSVPGETGILYPRVLEAYGRLSETEPFHFAPLLKDSVIYQETWQGDVTLIREIDRSGPRSFSGPQAASLQAALDEILGTARQVPQDHETGQAEIDLIESMIASLHQLLIKEPSLYEVHYNLGVLYQAAGKPDEAEKEYLRTLEQKPRNTKALLNLGLLLLQDDKVTEAERHFRRLSRVDPRFAGSFYLLGVCEHKRNAYTEAEEDLRRSIDLLPSFLYPCIELGSVQRKLGREEEARKSFLVVLHHPNASPRELLKLACCLLESGWLQEANAAFDRLLKKGDPEYEVWNNRAVAYLRKGEAKLARSDLNRAIKKDPARPEAFNNMGMAHVREEAYEDAVAYFLHAARLETSFREALLNAAVVYGQYLDNAEKATRCVKDYLGRGGTVQRDMLLKWLGSTYDLPGRSR